MTTTHTDIALLDSGVGGLTILGAIQRILPQASTTYLLDNLAFPYGIKSDAELIERLKTVFDRLLTHTSPQVIVLACNSASTIALEALRSTFSVPIVGVVPAIKTAAEKSKTKTIGLLATPGTINRVYTQKLIDDFASDCHVIRIGSSELVHMAERKLQNQPIDLVQFSQLLQPFSHDTLDTVVLGCTHFPHLLDELKKQLSDNIQFIDSSEAVAKQTARVLKTVSGMPPTHRAILTREDPNLAAQLKGHSTYQITAVDQWR